MVGSVQTITKDPPFAEQVAINLKQGAKQLGLVLVTAVYDLKALLSVPKSICDLNDFTNAWMTAAQYATDQTAKYLGEESVQYIWMKTVQDSSNKINGIFGLFKLCQTTQDLRTLSSQPIWKQGNIVFKAIDTVCGTADWLLKAEFITLAGVSANTGIASIALFAGKCTLVQVKRGATVIASICGIINSAYIIADDSKKANHVFSWVSIAADSGKIGIIAASAGSGAWIFCLVMWASGSLAKTLIEVHQERLKTAQAHH